MVTLSLNCKDLYERHGFNFYDSNYNINIFGIRKENPKLNKFDEYLYISYNDYSIRQMGIVHRYTFTSIPGITYLEDKMLNKNGTFILLPSTSKYGRQYKFVKGTHHGKYDCLIQKKGFPVVGYRDNNKDGKPDLIYDDKTRIFESDDTSIHIHHATSYGESTEINGYSAGCQVLNNINDWDNFWSHYEKSARMYGYTVTYTLFQESDLTEDEKEILLG